MKKRKYKGRHYYTEQETEWLKKNGHDKSIYQLIEEFNSTFGTDMQKTALRCYLTRLGINLGRKSKYTPEVHAYIRHCYCELKMTSTETVKEVNRKFGEGTFTDREMHNYISYHHLINDMVGRPTKSMFKKGHKPTNFYPKGSIVFIPIKNTSRRQKLIKIDDSTGWMLYNRWLWEQHHGAVPEGHVVISLSRTDDVQDISDLICVPKTDAAKNYKKMEADSIEFNRNRILITQLDRLIKEKEDGNKNDTGTLRKDR